MKSKLTATVILIIFISGSAIVMGQDRNENKIKRLQNKIEKQSKKLHELTGEEYHVTAPPDMDRQEIKMVMEKAMLEKQRAMEDYHAAMREGQQAMKEQQEIMRKQQEDMRAKKRDFEDQSIIISKRDIEKLSELGRLDSCDLKPLRDMEIDIRKDLDGKRYHYYFKTPKLEIEGLDPKVFEMPDLKFDIPEFKEGALIYNFGNQDNLSINKDLADESGSADFNYEVKEGAVGINVNVNGSMYSGTVRITIKRPDGELFNEYTLSPLANVNWRQNIKFENLDKSAYLGKWAVSVTAEKAKGRYSIRLNSL